MAQITTLIDKQDNVELIRDTIAAILIDEISNQQSLATAAAKDPRDWALRIYLERNNPVSDFLDPAPEQKDNPPVVNIQLDSWSMDASKSNQVERQGITAVYHIDCYGFGISTDLGPNAGHDPGDARSALEAQRAVRLVRNILMSSFYTYLGLPRGGMQSVWRRWVDSVSVFQPQLDNRAANQVMAARMQFNVEFSEFSPQYEAMLLEIVNTTIKRKETGEVYIVAQYDYT